MHCGQVLAKCRTPTPLYPFKGILVIWPSIPSLICFRKMEWWEMEVVDKGSGHWDHPLVLLTHLTLLF